MSSRPRAPRTAHLRKAISKASQRATRQKAPTTNPSTAYYRRDINKPESGALVIERSRPYPSPEAIDRLSQVCLQVPPHLSAELSSEIKLSEKSEKLCVILSELAHDFKGQHRFYSAMAANAAVALVRLGREDDINAGLWPHIFKTEQALKQLGKEKENDKETVQKPLPKGKPH